MVDDLALRVGGLEKVVEQLTTNQSRQLDLLERVVRLEERHGKHSAALAKLEADVRENAKGVTDAAPWVELTRSLSGHVATVAVGLIGAYLAYRFGLQAGG